MAVNGGYRDRIARIDLSSGQVGYEQLDEDDVERYLGARGLGAKFVFDNGPSVDPLSPDNLLAFMTGPMTGSSAIMSGRIAVCTKSPLTGTVTDSHHGGWSGARLKWSGLDGLLIEGASEDPVYLYVEDGSVEIRDASHIWGDGTKEARQTLESEIDAEYGTDLSFMGIGPAGENQVRYACIINEDDRASGRGGTGCVMGSKMVKAVVVKADSNPPEPANPDLFNEGSKQARTGIVESDLTGPNEGGLSVFGTNVLMNVTNEIDALPTRNSRYTSSQSEAAEDPSEPNVDAERISGETIRNEILADEPTCHACPVACKKEVEVPDPETGELVRIESYEYESAWALGENVMNDDNVAVAHLINACNDMGMDTIETGNAIAMAMEAVEMGLVDADLDWGDAARMQSLISEIANRDGEFADSLAEGTSRAADEFGDRSLTMTVKGQAIPAYDPRGLKGMGISYATSNRGGCHLRGYTPSAELLGVPTKVEPQEWRGKGELCATFQDLSAITDSLDICKFNSFGQGMDEYIKQFNGMTGLDFTENDLLQAGERIYTLERYYNNQAGFDGEDDSLPSRFLEGGIPGQGASEGQFCELEQMKAEYYEVRGWNNGVVPEDKLDDLSIERRSGAGVSAD